MRATLRSSAESDLIFLRGDKNIPLDIQFTLVTNGLNTLGRLATLEDEKAVFRKAVAELAEINLETATAKKKLVVSDHVQCWSAAKNFIEAENELKANAAASSSDIPLPLPKRTYQAMAAAYVEANGKISDREAPGKPLMAMTLSMVQDNDPIAEPLTHIASKADGEDDITFDEADYSGAIKGVHRKVKVVPLPKDPEELRMRYTIIENALLYAQFKHSNRS